MQAVGVGIAVRIWWPQDGCWHAGRVTLTSEESGEFLVDYDDEEDGEGWVSTSHKWESASSIVPGGAAGGGDGEARARVAAEVAAALSRQAAERAAEREPDTAGASAPTLGAQDASVTDTEDLDPVADRAQIEERFMVLYEAAMRAHGDALADPAVVEAGFQALLQSTVGPPT